MVINYLARSVLGVAAPAIMAEQHISAAEYSWITGAFQIGIMFQPLAGYVLDVVGLKIGFTLFVTVWSLITMAHGLATGWMGFAGLRGALGLVEGSAQPAGMKLVAEWFPARERGVAGGIYQIGASFGAVFAPPLVAWAVLNHSWRAAFFIAGALGLVWVIAWLFWYAPPAKHRRLSPAERTLIVEGQEASLATHRKRPPLGELLRRRNLWAIAAARFLADPVWGMLSFWMPLYLVQV
ncbi:MAG: MFS transporter, partial [Sphingomonas sp.]